MESFICVTNSVMVDEDANLL